MSMKTVLGAVGIVGLTIYIAVASSVPDTAAQQRKPIVSATLTKDVLVTVQKVYDLFEEQNKPTFDPTGRMLSDGKNKWCMGPRGEDPKGGWNGRLKGVPDDQWCKATVVTTNDLNVSDLPLRYYVVCSAYGTGDKVLGHGTSADQAPDMYSHGYGMISELTSPGRGGSWIRLPNVKFGDVLRVECNPFVKS